MNAGTGWGPGKDLDYWSAHAAGHVNAQEVRAMGLLASLSDEERFAFYCVYGVYPALGNMTRRVFFVRRFLTVLEMDDGAPVGSWCVVTRDRGDIPETDHVVALKNLIEGEEAAFREIGNRMGFVRRQERILMPGARVGIPSAFPVGLIEEDAGDSFDPLGQKRIMEACRGQAVEARESAMRAALRKAPGYREPEPAPIPMAACVAGIGLGGYITTDNTSTMGGTPTGNIQYVPSQAGLHLVSGGMPVNSAMTTLTML